MAMPDTLEVADRTAIAKQFACALQGLSLTWEALQLVEGELRKLEGLTTSVPIGKGALLRARDELRKVLADALKLADAVGVDKSELAKVMAGPATTNGVDVGRVTREQAQLVDVTPGASFISLGENLAGKAVAKLGARRAVGAASTFARASGARVKAALGILAKGSSAFARGPFGGVAKKALVFYAAATALRFALTGGAPILSTPGGVAVAALAVFLLIGKRR